MKKSYYRTDFLYSMTSFLIGMGSILSLFGPYFSFNYSSSAKEADRNAIESDFGVIGKDIEFAINQYKR